MLRTLEETLRRLLKRMSNVRRSGLAAELSHARLRPHERGLARPIRESYPDLVKVREVVRMIEDDGWFQVRQRGSHRQFKHVTKPGLVTVAGKPNDDLAPGTLNSVLRQAGLRP